MIGMPNIPKPVVKFFLILSAIFFALPLVNNFLIQFVTYIDWQFWVTMILAAIALILCILVSFGFIPLPASAWMIIIGIILVLVSAGISIWVFYDAFQSGTLTFSFNFDEIANAINSTISYIQNSASNSLQVAQSQGNALSSITK